MAFKKVTDYNEDKFGGLFLLRNDGDSADVIFMYRSVDDALVANTHYIKSSTYSGYVHCCEEGCPACKKGIRVQTKLFIPLYNITTGRLEFWDRNIRFDSQLQQDVFSRYPDPSGFVFRIKRHGVANDVNTTYSISAVGVNNFKSYDQILSENSVQYPDHYSTICREYSAAELDSMINTTDSSATASNMPKYEYTPTPRAAFSPSEAKAEYSAPAVPDLNEIEDDIGDDVNF